MLEFGINLTSIIIIIIIFSHTNSMILKYAAYTFMI